MRHCTSPVSWQPILESLSPAVVALLSATALWVASRARSTSKDALWISESQERALALSLRRPTRNASPRAVRARRKSSSRTTTSTSRGDPGTRRRPDP